jgi:hypothetical protein
VNKVAKKGTSVPKPAQERSEFGKDSQKLEPEPIEAAEDSIAGITPEIEMQLRNFVNPIGRIQRQSLNKDSEQR